MKWADLFRDFTIILAVLIGLQAAYLYTGGANLDPASPNYVATLHPTEYWTGAVTLFVFCVFLALTLTGDVAKAKADDWGL